MAKKNKTETETKTANKVYDKQGKGQNKFGHKLSSKSAYVDSLLVQGKYTLAQIAEKVAKEFSVPEKQGLGKTKEHCKHLEGRHKVPFKPLTPVTFSIDKSGIARLG